MLSSGGWAVLIIGGAIIVEAVWVETRDRWARQRPISRQRAAATGWRIRWR